MKLKLTLFNFITIFLFCLFISRQALGVQFAIENYSEFASLSYDYTFDGINWTWCAFLPAVTKNPKSFVKLPFDPSIPISWKIEATNGKRLHCVDYFTHQDVPSIVTLKDKKYETRDMLLLEVLQNPYVENKFFAQIIDLDGSSEYSNTIECVEVGRVP